MTPGSPSPFEPTRGSRLDGHNVIGRSRFSNG
jgi:hypothetical protein